MITRTTTARVRYGEVDQMGFMYYGNYALYFEMGRADMIREAGYTYAQMEKDGVVMPVIKMQCKYLRPALYDELITIETRLETFQPDSTFITFVHRLFNEKGDLIHKGEVTLTFFDPKTQKRVPMPQVLIDFLSPYFSPPAQ